MMIFEYFKNSLQDLIKLEEFIKNNKDEFKSLLDNKIQLLDIESELQEIILFKKKIFKKLDLTKNENYEFLVILIKITNLLFLNTETKILLNLLSKYKLTDEMNFINSYIDLQSEEEYINFNKELFLKKIDLNELLIGYYINIVLSFESRAILNNLQQILQNLDINNDFFNKLIDLKLDKVENKKLEIFKFIDNNFNFKTTKKLTPTPEQLDIIETSKNMLEGQVLLIDALAGCSKTTTLEIIARENKDKRFLYLAFNKKIVQEAKNRFPPNTEARTLHSLAFQYEGQNKYMLNNLNDIISKLFNLDIGKDYNKIYDINRIYNEFCLSENSIDELDLLKNRLILEVEEEFKHKDKNDKKANQQKSFKIKKIEDAMADNKIKILYEFMFDSDKVTHNTYLKKFVENIGNYALNYDFIVLDESQDVSRILAKFIINLMYLQRYKLIIVGDNNQKIYGFLNNISLSKYIRQLADKTIYIDKKLTYTFRFKKDSEIEKLSNLILNLRNHKIVGAKKDSNQIKQTKAYLSRSKVSVLFKALEFIKLKESFNLIMNKEQDFKISEIIDMYNLYEYTMIMKKELISQNKLNSNLILQCQVPYKGFITKTKRNKEIKSLVIEEVVSIFRNYKRNDIFPKFINKKFNQITSIYELEYNIYKYNFSDMLDSLKITYFIKLNFEIFDKLKTIKTYSHIVDKAISILVDEYSDNESLNIVSTIHKVKGLEFESVDIISNQSLLRVPTIIDDDNIKVLSEKSKIIGLCNPSDDEDCGKEFKKQEDEKKLNSSNKPDLSNVFDNKNYNSKKLSLKKEKQQEKNYIELFIDRKIDTQEEYNILYVAITRAKTNLEIYSSTYQRSLNFLEFIQKNIQELNKIIDDKDSNLLKFYNNKKGVIYNNEFFISKEVLEEFVLEFKEYF